MKSLQLVVPARPVRDGGRVQDRKALKPPVAPDVVRQVHHPQFSNWRVPRTPGEWKFPLALGREGGGEGPLRRRLAPVAGRDGAATTSTKGATGTGPGRGVTRTGVRDRCHLATESRVLVNLNNLHLFFGAVLVFLLVAGADHVLMQLMIDNFLRKSDNSRPRLIKPGTCAPTDFKCQVQKLNTLSPPRITETVAGLKADPCLPNSLCGTWKYTRQYVTDGFSRKLTNGTF